ncbi:hypothetical protein [Metallosphaera javensis (ex Sakai et al. 2022)]|nr:MAG: inorganic phosphate transporter [Metallosphaera javensis (ex Sakai et al. 2022)]
MILLAGLSFIAVLVTTLLPEPNQVSLAEREIQLRGVQDVAEEK